MKSNLPCHDSKILRRSVAVQKLHILFEVRIKTRFLHFIKGKETNFGFKIVVDASFRFKPLKPERQARP